MRKICLLLIVALVLCSMTGFIMQQTSDSSDLVATQIKKDVAVQLQEEKVLSEEKEEMVLYYTSNVSSRSGLISISVGNNVSIEVSQNATGYTIISCTYSASSTTGAQANLPIELTISKSNQYPITAIGENAFKGCNFLRTINLSGLDITKIHANAFRDCSNLATISLPTTVKEFGRYCFFNTLWADSARDTSGLLIVNNVLVEGRRARGVVNIPSSVENIMPGAFAYNEQITEINFPESGVSSIPEEAFYAAYNLQKVNFASTIQNVGAHAFYLCKNLNTLENYSKLIRVGRYSFAKCQSLTTFDVSGSTSFIEVDENAFRDCTSLTTVKFSKYIQNIYLGAFSDCSKLATVEFAPDTINLVSIGDVAFAECPLLDTSSFPSCTKGMNWNRK